MSKPTDTMKKYETEVDRGDQNETQPDSVNQPDSANQTDNAAQAPAPTNDQADPAPSAPIPQAEPQSPVQTEESLGSKAENIPLVSDQKAGESQYREYREVKEGGKL